MNPDLKAVQAWRELLVNQEERFLGESMHASLTYLLNARSGKEGWAQFSGMEPNIQSTAVVVAALSKIETSMTKTAIADIAVHYRKKHTGDLTCLDAATLCDLLVITAAESKFDRGYIDNLCEQLASRYSAAIDNPNHPWSVALISRLVIALSACGVSDKWSAFEEGLVSELITRQNTLDGGWPAGGEGDSIAISTASAVCALTEHPYEAVLPHVKDGIRFLTSQIRKNGWGNMECVGAMGTYPTTQTLLALGKSGIADPHIIQAGIDNVRSLINEDGGCGAVPGSASSIEYTARAVTSLVAAGAGNYVPAGLARLALLDADSELTNAVRERDDARANVGAQAQEICSGVMTERERLQDQVDGLKKQLIRAHRKLRSMRDMESRFNYPDIVAGADLRLRSVRSSAYKTGFIVLLITGIILAITIVTNRLFTIGSSKRQEWFGISSILVAIPIIFALISIVSSFILARSTRSKRASPDETNMNELWELSNKGRDLRSSDVPQGQLRLIEALWQFREVTEDLPASVREELVYRLLYRMPDLPRDIAPRFATEILLSLKAEHKTARAVERWVDKLATYPPTERRIILQAIQQGIK